MMSKIHNKKRNVGLIYEMLLREISKSIIDENSQRAKTTIDIVKRHFKKGTQLHKEYRLFNALIKMNVPTELLAMRILDDAKKISETIDQKQLSNEKTQLIHEINRKLGKDIYENHVPNYRIYATVQTLLNDWRNLTESDLRKVVEFENKIKDWLLKEKVEESFDDLKFEKTDNLVIKIMSDKINERYQKELSEEQKEILRNYAFYMSEDKHEEMKEYLNSLKEETISSLTRYLKEENNAYLNSKAGKVIQEIADLSLDQIDDDLISKVLVISNLKNTILENK